MRTAKQEALAAINVLPDEATFEEIQYRLYVLEHIRTGLAELEAGEGIPHEEVVAEFARWLDD
jgi:predicted transcriptional regulator